ncbi:MAG: hypothetical protein COA43_00715 [Robiginitomaculum sp.]|nr:MAG: hypothetical protein COA43_00715 [Robiginitomaculum sp.]
MVKFIKYMVLFALACFPVQGAFAQDNVKQSLDKMWSDAGMTVSVQGAQRYKTQEANYVTFGNVSIRAPQESYNLLSLQAPKVTAGCGGIDLYLGGFSFISSEQLEAMFKGIAQNAPPIAFMLAMETFAPQLNAQLKELAQKADKINQFSMQSCADLEQNIGGLFNQIPAVQRQQCINTALANGDASDRADAIAFCTNQGRATQTQDAATPKQKELFPEGNNYTWNSLKKHIFLDNEQREFIMTMVGSVVVQKRVNDNDEPRIDFLPATVSDKSKLNILLYGGDLEILSCQGEYDKCLEAPSSFKTVNIPANRAFASRTAQMLVEIYTKKKNRQALSDEEIAFVNNVQFPILRIINLYSAYYPESQVSAELTAMSEIIAIEIVSDYLSKTIATAKVASSVSGISLKELSTEWLNSMDNAQNTILEYQQTYHARKQQVMAYTALLDRIESEVQGRISSSMQSFISQK